MSLFSMFARIEQPPQNPIGGDIILATALSGGTYPGTGLTWNDISGFNNNGTLSSTSGVTWGGSGAHRFLSINGTSNSITFSPSSFSKTNISISLWIWQETSGPAGSIFTGLGTSLFLNGTLKVTASCTTQVGGSTGTVSNTPNFVIGDSAWYNMVLTFGNGIFSYYLDKILRYSAPTTYTTLPTSNTITIPGAFVKYISYINVTEKTLTSAEVTTNYNSQVATYG